MFTGVVLGCGSIAAILRIKGGLKLEIETPANFPAVKIGGSVSVNGACLTAVKAAKNRLFFDVVGETVRRTGLGALKKGSLVHLEPAMRLDDRVEGHFVQGHVDGTGTVKTVRREKADLHIEITFPSALKPFVLEKGSIAVDGVSLTLGKVSRNAFWVHLIPHTLKMTRFPFLKPGNRVNLEADILIKFFKSL